MNNNPYIVEIDCKEVQCVIRPTDDTSELLEQFGKVMDIIIAAQKKALAASPISESPVMRKAILEDRLVTLGAILEEGGGSHPTVKALQQIVDESIDELEKLNK